MMFILLLAASGIAATRAANSIDVYHRVFHPDVGETQFASRGQVLLDSTPSFVSSSSVTDDFASFAQMIADYSKDDRALYQVALESGGSWAYSSIKYCHLGPAIAEDIVLHASMSAPFEPYALDYFVAPIPHNGACSSESGAPTFTNITVTFRRPHLPPLPELRGQPVVVAHTPGGEPIPPPEEKTFFQKYWIYILAVTIALMLSGGAAPEEGGGGGARRA